MVRELQVTARGSTHRYAGAYVWGVYDILVLPPSFPYGGMEASRSPRPITHARMHARTHALARTRTHTIHARTDMQPNTRTNTHARTYAHTH